VHSATDIILGLYDAWHARDRQAWVDAFSPSASWTNIPTGETFTGPVGMATNYQNWDGPFPEGRCENLTVHAGADLVVAEFIASGTHTGILTTPDGPIPATGRTLSVPFCDVHDVTNGAITTTRRYWDQLAVLNQLGLL
jgi:ketosteroid isomerase-like protein